MQILHTKIYSGPVKLWNRKTTKTSPWNTALLQWYTDPLLEIRLIKCCLPLAQFYGSHCTFTGDNWLQHWEITRYENLEHIDNSFIYKSHLEFENFDFSDLIMQTKMAVIYTLTMKASWLFLKLTYLKVLAFLRTL